MILEATTKIERVSWDTEAMIDLTMGRGFIINEKAFKKDGKEQVKLRNGTHSPIYGTDWDDENSFAELYRCHCGATIGRVFEGEECSECHTVVTFKDISLATFGWIKVNSHAIIQPLYYKTLVSAIGKNVFPNIIMNSDIEQSGLLKDTSDKNNPFSNIGMVEFKERYEEILNYYKTKRKNKIELIDHLLENKDKVFSSFIPVYSAILRPVSFSSETVFMTKIDKKYNVIVSKARIINNLSKGRRSKQQKDLEVSAVLLALQRKLNELWTMIFSLIDQKNGHIRENLLGGRMNYTARNVIRPDFTLRADEIRLNYHTFAELFKYEIISQIVTTSRVSYKRAYNMWSIGIKDGSLSEVMKYVLKHHKPKIFINRNPTINYGSFLVMRVRDIIFDLSDYTMAIPNQVLKVLNADYDGDNLNIGSFKSADFAEAYEKIFNPRKNMFIDRNTGLFNNDMNLHKDQMIGLYEFCNI